MHHAGEKLIPIAKSDDKCQITAMLAASMTGKYLTPQLICIGKTQVVICQPPFQKDETSDIQTIIGPMKLQCYGTTKTYRSFHQSKTPSFEAQEVTQWSCFV